MELSPGSFRTFVVGTSYQLGNLVSSASSTIEATIGERFPLPAKEVKGEEVHRYEYGKVICIFMGCVYAYVILITLIGYVLQSSKIRNLSADGMTVPNTLGVTWMLPTITTWRRPREQTGRASSRGQVQDQRMMRKSPKPLARKIPCKL